MSYKRWVLVAIAVFGIGLIIGLVPPPTIADLISEELAVLEELGAEIVPFDILTALLIFGKNAVAVLVSFALSPVFLLTPIMALALNGVLVSFVSVSVAQEESVGYVLAGLLPHGVLEIPALIMAQAAALSFGFAAMTAIFNKEKRPLVGPNFKKNFRYVLIALVLLFPAAIIETFLTPLLLK
jgi:stage II sporulation protein M